MSDDLAATTTNDTNAAGPPRVFAVITGGGTSGHVLPALAIADALVAAGEPASAIHYVGTSRGVETRLVGLQRNLSRRNLVFLPKLVRSVRRATVLLRELRPAVVVNVGGYASFPATLAATRAKIPVVVVSYDRRPGLVSRLLARRAAACAVAFPGSTLPHAELTGAPVRQPILAIDRAADRAGARTLLGLPAERFVIGVCCGSLGAQPVNDVVAALVDQLADRNDLAIHHVVGERFLSEAAPARDGRDGIMYSVVGYEERMPALYAAADLMITRAGAGTIAELSAAGVPAIIVPWPGAAENHQVDNARQLSDVGGAVLVEQHELTAGHLASVIDGLVNDRERLASIARAAHVAGAPARSGALTRLIHRVAGA